MRRMAILGGMLALALVAIMGERPTSSKRSSAVSGLVNDAVSLNSFDLTRFDFKRADDDEALRRDEVMLHVELPDKVGRLDRIRANITLVNHSDPYFPLTLHGGGEIDIEIHNARGERCEPNGFGQANLPRRSNDGNFIPWNGSAYCGALLPGQSHRWTLEIGRCFFLPDGYYTLQAIFPDVGTHSEPIRSQLYTFEVLGNDESQHGEIYISKALPFALPVVSDALAESNSVGFNSLISLDEDLTTIAEHEFRPVTFSASGEEESGSVHPKIEIDLPLK